MKLHTYLTVATLLAATSLTLGQGPRNPGAPDRGQRERAGATGDRMPPAEQEFRRPRQAGPSGPAEVRRKVEVEIRRQDGARPQVRIEQRLQREGGGQRLGGRGPDAAGPREMDRMQRRMMMQQMMRRHQMQQWGGPRMQGQRNPQMRGQWQQQFGPRGPMMQQRGQQQFGPRGPMMQQRGQQFGPRGPMMQQRGQQQFGPRGPMMQQRGQQQFGPRGPMMQQRGQQQFGPRGPYDDMQQFPHGPMHRPQ
jgi:hypothetical protein